METIRESKIERIYEVIAEKKEYEANGCPRCNDTVTNDYYPVSRDGYFRYTCVNCGELTYEEDEEIVDMKHIKKFRKVKKVMIGDVIDWLTVNDEYIPFNYFETFEDLDKRWGKLRKPLEEQSDECIDYLYSLLPTEDDLKRK